MATIIQLITQGANGDAEVFVNADNIRTIKHYKPIPGAYPNYKSTISFDGADSLHVKETIFEIADAIKKA